MPGNYGTHLFHYSFLCRAYKYIDRSNIHINVYIYMICIHVDTGSHLRLYKLRISTWGEALPFAKKVAHAAAFVLRGDSGD